MNLKNFFVGRGAAFVLILIVIVVVFGFHSLNHYIYEEKQGYTAHEYKDGEYVIDSQRVRLTDGVSQTDAAPGSATKVVTRFFGNEVRSDLNDDGREDVAFLLTQDTGGSGTFYYVVAALNTDHGYVGSQAFLLGDRIAPQTTEISRDPGHKNVIVVNYADRKPGEPFTTQPSIGKSIWLKLDPASLQFGTVEQDFSGEADPAKMTLGMKKWNWVSALYNDGQKIVPKNPERFTLTFGADGTFSATTDCNGMGGKYTVTGNQITFSDMISTLMYCEGSDESTFAKLLTDAQFFHFTSKGELVLDLKFDSGSVIFR